MNTGSDLELEEVGGNIRQRKNSRQNGNVPNQFANVTNQSATMSHDESQKATIAKQLALDAIEERTQVLKKALMLQMDQQMTEMMKEFMTKVQSIEAEVQSRPENYLFKGGYHIESSRKKRADGSLPDKEFIDRNSLLTDLFQVNHIQTIYHIFVAILILLFINTVVYDIVDLGRVDLDFELIQWAFGDFRTVLITWVGMMFCTLVVVFPGFHFWSHQRASISQASQILLWDSVWLTAYIIYIGAIIYIPCKETIIHKLPPASCVTLLMEQVRLLMKTHAFVRSNIPQTLYFCRRKQIIKDEVNSSDDELLCPDFSRYLYFIFAPTLVYRNYYPRTRQIKWKWVVWNFLHVVGVLFYLYFIFVRFCVPVFRQFGQEPLTAKALVLSVFGCMLPGTLVLLCGFFLLLHSWLNAFAEMLRFADRMFYKDWWNSSTYATYYRTWNVVVHDWLYTYIYKDIYELCGRRNRVIPMLVVFAMSSLFHEYIITFTFRSFYPVLLLLFGGFGLAFAFLTNVHQSLGNIFMWLTLFMGTGLCMSLYSMEWYARINCPPSFEGFMDYIIPRSWTCLTLNR